MRTQYLFIPLLSLLFIAAPAYAVTPVDTAAETEEEEMPDAMSRLMKAPDINLKTIRDPFLSTFEKDRIEQALRSKKHEELPTQKRKRDVLEDFDLSTLTLVGTYQKKGHDWVASVQDSRGKAYTIRRGDYMGKNGGRIEKIDGQTIYLVEQTVNPAGDIVDRQVTLTLAEINDAL